MNLPKQNPQDLYIYYLYISGHNGTSKVLAKSSQSKRGKKIHDVLYCGNFFIICFIAYYSNERSPGMSPNKSNTMCIHYTHNDLYHKW